MANGKGKGESGKGKGKDRAQAQPFQDIWYLGFILRFVSLFYSIYNSSAPRLLQFPRTKLTVVSIIITHGLAGIAELEGDNSLAELGGGAWIVS